MTTPRKGSGRPGNLLLDVLGGKIVKTPPLWMMRQAGRYLPEYREVRKQAGSFLDLCYNPALATEVTLQPIRRFGFDAAILFSDILVVPHAFGQKVWFEEGEGPRLEVVSRETGLRHLKDEIDLEHLAPVLETVDRLSAALPRDTALIGFCGAPWTVASYMVAGKGTPDQAPARLVAYADPDFLQQIVDKLVAGSINYLNAQIAAGAQAVQIFESFASALPPALLQRWSVDPISRIVAGVKSANPQAKVVVFARGSGPQVGRFAAIPGVDGIGVDWMSDLGAVASQVAVTTQGNLDPLALVAGGEALRAGVETVLTATAGRPHIFNLGHGIVPQTPVEHVEQFVKLVRG
jgi:uroporphyrinogen decarboxylase